MLELTKLEKQYGTNGPKALQGVDLTVSDGEVLGLIGPSGAGKSTLIRCVNRLVEPTEGKIFLDGEDVLAIPHRNLRHLRRRIGMIFQEYALVDRLTVMENVLSGQLGYVDFWHSWRRKFPQGVVEYALNLIERVGLIEYVDTRADQLSGGQRQRVGIARALIQKPSLLLVDEPTSSLDPKTSREVIRLIMELVREYGLSTGINIHDVPLAKRFIGRIVGLREGLIVYDGPPTSLDSRVLSEIYGDEDWETDTETSNEAEVSREESG